MPIDQSFVGRVYPPTAPYQVGREKIREFAAAAGDANPASHDPEAARRLGYPDLVAPPTFAIVVTMSAATQIVTDPTLGLDYSRVVHREQRFVYSRPITAGDELVVVVSVEAIASAAGNDVLTTRGEVSTTAGEHVVTAFSTLVARGTAAG
ncbi:MAG: FAS1-like dehydratase domain-containing protein [Jatrophihabitans sp.]